MVHLTIPAPADPAPQRRQPDPKVLRDLASRAAARPNQPNRFVLKLLRKPSLLPHGDPPASWGTLHFSEASPGTLKKKLGYAVASERGEDGVRRYRIAA